jgi:hypothetical protein
LAETQITVIGQPDGLLFTLPDKSTLVLMKRAQQWQIAKTQYRATLSQTIILLLLQLFYVVGDDASPRTFMVGLGAALLCWLALSGCVLHLNRKAYLKLFERD